MYSMVASSVWRRRTNKIIAAAVVIIGLTMMISTIPQCIYVGMIFIVFALSWLGWIRMKEKKLEETQSRTLAAATTSPILFIMASQHSSNRPMRPSVADPNDKPPSYDQVTRLDELPPDYFSILSAKPPRYEDVEQRCSRETNSPNLPGVHIHGTTSTVERISSCSSSSVSPLTLEVPHLLQDVGLLRPGSTWTLNAGENLPHSDIDVRLQEGGTLRVGLPPSYLGLTSAGEAFSRPSSTDSSTKCIVENYKCVSHL